MNEFQKIDSRLKLYYESVGRNDYVDANGIGKFLQFSIDNGFNEEDINDELNVDDPADCMYIEFDDNFPLSQDINGEAEQQNEILKIIKNCYENNVEFIPAASNQLDKIQWELKLNKKEYDVYKNILSKQLKETFISCKDEMF
eukprot:283353_1